MAVQPQLTQPCCTGTQHHGGSVSQRMPGLTPRETNGVAIEPNGSTADRADAIYAAIGDLNQCLFVVPRYDLVVVVTGQSNASSPASFFFSDILPAVRASYGDT